MNALWVLMRSPRRGAAMILAGGRLPIAVGLVVLATAVAAINAARFAADVPVASVLYGDDRSPAIGSLIDAVGRDRAAVIGYLIEQAWTAVIVVTAFSPLLVWVLGATAVHAELPQRRAFIVLAFAIVVFYVVPLVLIVASVVVLVIAAVVLEYVPR